MDPLLTTDGKPYAPIRYKEIITERYIISKFLHTSYVEVGLITPSEREHILYLISDELKRKQQLIDELQAKMKGQ